MNQLAVLVADPDEYVILKPALARWGAKDVSSPFSTCQSFMVNGTSVMIVCSGIGKVNAAAATMWAIDHGCDFVFNYGYSGGLSGVRKGEFMLADCFAEHDFDLTPLGYQPAEKPGQTDMYRTDPAVLSFAARLLPGIAVGTALTGDCFVCDENRRSMLIKQLNGMSCDMESAAIASVCHNSHIPFLCLRKISDDAGDHANETYREQSSVLAGELCGVAETVIDALTKDGNL